VWNGTEEAQKEETSLSERLNLCLDLLWPFNQPLLTLDRQTIQRVSARVKTIHLRAEAETPDFPCRAMHVSTIVRPFHKGLAHTEGWGRACTSFRFTCDPLAGLSFPDRHPGLGL
jgi:hypothetical protein